MVGRVAEASEDIEAVSGKERGEMVVAVTGMTWSMLKQTSEELNMILFSGRDRHLLLPRRYLPKRCSSIVICTLIKPRIPS